MAEAPVIGELERRRLRWRARRGMLENDLIISRFLDREGDVLDITEILALEALLDLPDNELIDLLLARKDPQGALDNNAVRSLLERMRTT
ncbi:MAG TPA: succinate dehydrogenase assembly factor 2 [Burkholderiaceae bacterium]|nr:succinate dehydrogenase assembly factor 2 [Burkholderiaceae bacterium]